MGVSEIMSKQSTSNNITLFNKKIDYIISPTVIQPTWRIQLFEERKSSTHVIFVFDGNESKSKKFIYIFIILKPFLSILVTLVTL